MPVFVPEGAIICEGCTRIILYRGDPKSTRKMGLSERDRKYLIEMCGKALSLFGDCDHTNFEDEGLFRFFRSLEAELWSVHEDLEEFLGVTVKECDVEIKKLEFEEKE